MVQLPIDPHNYPSVFGIIWKLVTLPTRFAPYCKPIWNYNRTLDHITCLITPPQTIPFEPNNIDLSSQTCWDPAGAFSAVIAQSHTPCGTALLPLTLMACHVTCAGWAPLVPGRGSQARSFVLPGMASPVVTMDPPASKVNTGALCVVQSPIMHKPVMLSSKL